MTKGIWMTKIRREVKRLRKEVEVTLKRKMTSSYVGGMYQLSIAA